MNKIEVLAINTSTRMGAKMDQHDTIVAMKDRGLQPDRYANGTGAYSKSPRKNVPDELNQERDIIRDVSIISEEAILAANAEFGTDFDFDYSRRNILVRGIEDLSKLVGWIFVVGGVPMLGIEPCDPCDRPDKLKGKKGFSEAFQKRGGLRARVLREGVIQVGNQVKEKGKSVEPYRYLFEQAGLQITSQNLGVSSKEMFMGAQDLQAEGEDKPLISIAYNPEVNIERPYVSALDNAYVDRRFFSYRVAERFATLRGAVEFVCMEFTMYQKIDSMLRTSVRESDRDAIIEIQQQGLDVEVVGQGTTLLRQAAPISHRPYEESTGTHQPSFWITYEPDLDVEQPFGVTLAQSPVSEPSKPRHREAVYTNAIPNTAYFKSLKDAANHLITELKKREEAETKEQQRKRRKN